MSMILFRLKSIREYDKYFAEYPGLSHLPSPPRISPLFLFLSSWIIWDCSSFQQYHIAGWRYFLWCVMYVWNVMTGMPAVFSICMAFVPLMPENWIASEMAKSPSAICVPLTKGWLDHFTSAIHLSHINVTVSLDPFVTHFSALLLLPHFGQCLNKISKLLWLTKYFGSFLS